MIKIKNSNFSNIKLKHLIKPPKTFSGINLDLWDAGGAPNVVAAWKDMAFSPSLKRLVAIGENSGGSKAMYSDDGGESWTMSPSNVSTGDWQRVIWVGDSVNLFVAVSFIGTTQSKKVMTSSDGISWTLQNTPSVIGYWHDICWSPELSLFVAVARFAENEYNKVMTSPDAINWTIRTTPNTDAQWASVCWSPRLSKFVSLASSASGDERCMTSVDGINWVGSVAESPYGINSIICAPSKNILVGVGGGGFYTSTDGTTWTRRYADDEYGSRSWRRVIWVSELGKFIAICSNGDTDRTIASSDDGITWVYHTTPLESFSWESVAYDSEHKALVAIARTGSPITNRAMRASTPL